MEADWLPGQAARLPALTGSDEEGPHLGVFLVRALHLRRVTAHCLRVVHARKCRLHICHGLRAVLQKCSVPLRRDAGSL